MSIQHQQNECSNCKSICKLLTILALLNSVISSIIACSIVSKLFYLVKKGGKIIDLKVNVCYKTEWIDLSSFKMKFFSCYYNSWAEI